MESPFVGHSEMARRMREVDWAGTTLGPPQRWPASLRTAVELLLRSQLPMYVAAGPRWALLYNDAYAPLLGDRHPDALAAPFATTWPELWPGLQPALADALAGKAVFQEDMPMLLARRDRPEEAWFTYSLSALGADESGAEGVFCACTETTGRVIGERRLRALSELARLGDATDVQAAGTAAVDVLSRYRADVPPPCSTCSTATAAVHGSWPRRASSRASRWPRRRSATTTSGRRPSGRWRRPGSAPSSPVWPAPCLTGGSPAAVRCAPGFSAASGTTRRRSTRPSPCRSGSARTGRRECSSPASAPTWRWTTTTARSSSWSASTSPRPPLPRTRSPRSSGVPST
ncbi:hypothetical protein [Pseudonocardia charpentierae]|uniref:PAS fold-containing protein n=1 Tax=Pseudonocardia charpentierae TaxID=3075545 RepID=A0ABU2NCL3_9PSEU|nr:hypothetical protein [Pseudonocardia sp. DSM 45834]MDT0351692.1 hypothetical protein [Pseudonocardia sp. DSM 45834]